MLRSPPRAIIGIALVFCILYLLGRSVSDSDNRLGLSTFKITTGHSHQAMDNTSSCPFFTIAASYPPTESQVPKNPNSELITPNCHLILSTPQVMAFLDILPITQGHVLVIPREHRETLKDLKGSQGAALGAWLPVVSRATMRALGRGEGDWNIVQNNGR